MTIPYYMVIMLDADRNPLTNYLLSSWDILVGPYQLMEWHKRHLQGSPTKWEVHLWEVQLQGGPLLVMKWKKNNPYKWPKIYGFQLGLFWEKKLHLHSGKLTWQWKSTFSTREYIYTWWNFRCYASLPECITIVGSPPCGFSLCVLAGEIVGCLAWSDIIAVPPSLPVVPPEVSCFRSVLGVQIPPHRVFGSQG